MNDMEDNMITRTKTGDVNVNGEHLCRVPRNELMISVLGLNAVPESGCTFDEDGWIRSADGKQLKKWFIEIDRVRVWGPKLKDISALEQKYRDVLSYSKTYLPVYTEAFQKVVEVKEAHCEPSNSHSNENKWWLYGGDEYGVSFDWVDRPDVPINLEIGQAYHYTEKRFQMLSGRAWRFRVVLEDAIERHLRAAQIKRGHANMLRVNINGRFYWYSWAKGSWKKHIWPDDELIQVTL